MKRSRKISPFWEDKLHASVVPQAHPLPVLADSRHSELLPSGHSPDEIRAWIKALSRRFDIAPTTLAKRAGLAPSTVNRFLSGKGLNENVSARTVNSLTKAAMEIYSEGARDFAAESLLKLAEDDPEDTAGRVALISFPVIGRVEAGVFKEAIEWDVEDRYTIHAPIRWTLSRKPVVGLEVRGASMDLVYPEGTVVICVPFYALDRSPRSGERVVVHKRDAAHGVEATVKEFRLDDAGNAWLVPLSSRVEHQAPIFLGPTVHGDGLSDDLLITMLVVGSFRPEPSFD